MLGNIICFIVGGFVGIFATCACVVASDRTESACAEAYEAGRRDGWKQTCMRLKTDCPAYERFIERGE